MSYIGKQPQIGNYQICDAISVVNGQAAYTMQVSSTNVVPESANHMIVSLNGVIQKPGSSFTISGSTITFSSNLATGDAIDFIYLLGNVLDLGVPSDDTVTAAKIGANAVTAAKLNNDIISGSTELASEPADTDEFLVSDAGTLKRIDYSLIKGGGITEVDRWKMSNQSYGTANVFDSGWSRYTTLSGAPHGTGMTESSGVFTFPSTGVYEILFNTYCWNNATTRGYIGVFMQGSSDGFSSNDQELSLTYGNTSTAQDHDNIAQSCIYDVTNTSNNKFRLKTTSEGTSGFYRTYLTFKKLMET